MKLVIRVDEELLKARAGLVFRTDLPYRLPNGGIGYRKGWVKPEDAKKIDRAKKTGGDNSDLFGIKREADLFDDDIGEELERGDTMVNNEQELRDNVESLKQKTEKMVRDKDPKSSTMPDEYYQALDHLRDAKKNLNNYLDNKANEYKNSDEYKKEKELARQAADREESRAQREREVTSTTYEREVRRNENHVNRMMGIKPNEQRNGPTLSIKKDEGKAPLYIESLTDKAIIVRGDTRTHKDEIKAAGGRWNGKYGGWIFPKTQEGKVREKLGKLVGDGVQKVDQEPVVQAETELKPFNDNQYKMMLERFYSKSDDEIYQAYEKAKQVGETRYVNGVQYVLNANHRWERADNEADAKVDSDTMERKKTADKLRTVADSLEQKAGNEIGRDRQSNTARRAKMASSAIASAEKDAAIARTMKNLANAIESGEVRHLSGVNSKAAVENLDLILRQAIQKRDRERFSTYPEQERNRGRNPELDDLKHAEIPEPSWGPGSRKQDLIDALKGKRGVAELKQKIEYGRKPDVELLSELKKHLNDNQIRNGLGWWNTEAISQVARLSRIGIKNNNDLRNALKEYIEYRDGPKKADPLKEAERALIGQKVGFDFFPTPKSLAGRMAGMAGLKPGMDVLEPSAGNGNLADAARDAGANVDTIEVSDSLRNILKLKGHNVAGNDFETHEPDKVYDAIIMNPPFSNRKDAEHIQLAYDMLKPGGKLVAIAGEGVFFGSDAKAKAFRDWLDSKEADVEKLPENTFKDKDLMATTGVNARLIEITKPMSEGPHVGDTKVINGVTYQLNANHRWERVDDGSTESEAAKVNDEIAQEAAEIDGKTKEDGQDGFKKIANIKDEPKPDAKAKLNELIDRAGGKEKLRTMLMEARKAEKTGKGSQINLQTGEVMNRVSEKVISSLANATGLSQDEILKEIGIKEKTATRSADVEPKNKTDSGDEFDPNSENYRYRDTGYIAGSRKELAAEHIKSLVKDGKLVRTSDVDWVEIEKNPRAARDLIVKSNLFGQVDWDTLKDSGMEPGAGFLVDRIYASVGKEPENNTESRKSYVYGIESLRDRLEKCKTVDQVMAVLNEINNEMLGEIYSAKESEDYQKAYAEYSRLKLHAKEMDDKRSALASDMNFHASAVRSLTYEQEGRARRGWKPDPKIEDKKIEAQKKWDDAKKQYDDFMNKHPELVSKTRDHGDGWTSSENDLEYEAKKAWNSAKRIKQAAQSINLLSNPITKSWLALGDRFNSVVRYRSLKGSDAFAGHVATARAGKIKDWDWAEKGTTTSRKPSKESVRFQLKVAETYERVGGRKLNIDSTMDLKNQFGLKDVQSGNWVLRDLNSAKFHTEQSAHAFADMADILGIPDKKLSMNGRLSMAFGARGHGNAGFGGAAKAHYEPVQRVINITKMGGGGSLAHEWFHSLDNMLAEAMGHSIDAKDFMLTEDPKALSGVNRELSEAFDGLRKAMLTGNIKPKKIFTYTANDVRTAKYNIDERPGRIGTAIKSAGSMEKAIDAIESMIAIPSGMLEASRKKHEKSRNEWAKIAAAYYGGEPKSDGVGSIEVRHGEPHSAFMDGARDLDGDRSKNYWSSVREMAARAFQSYVEDKLSDQGRRNDYLSVYADNKYHADPLTGVEFKPYPEGDERKRINAAFDRLFQVIKDGDVIQKAIDNLPVKKSGLFSFVIPLFRKVK